MSPKRALLFGGGVAGVLCLFAVLIIGHGTAEQTSHVMSAVNDLKDIYLHWKRSARPLNDRLSTCLADYRRLYDSRPVWLGMSYLSQADPTGVSSCGVILTECQTPCLL